MMVNFRANPFHPESPEIQTLSMVNFRANPVGPLFGVGPNLYSGNPTKTRIPDGFFLRAEGLKADFT